MNAITLRILLFYFYSPLQWNIESPAEQEAALFLRKAGLLNFREGTLISISHNDQHMHGDLKITERGRVHIKALLDAPLPKQVWVSPITSEEED
jgi:hypothetical protein